jgi:hypothetical protein
MDTYIRGYRPFSNWTTREWAPGWVPNSCWNNGHSDIGDIKDFKVYDITYEDCSEPFVVCIHKNAPVSLGDILPVSTEP